jgi:hypothetical protein
MRRRLWPRLAVGAIVGLLVELALIMLWNPNQAQTIIDPNRDTADLSVRVLGVEVHQRHGRQQDAESFKEVANSWANGLLAGWLLLGAIIGAGIAAMMPRQAEPVTPAGKPRE